nr:hypothetical protein [uncultured Anaerosporobacter sp.]
MKVGLIDVDGHNYPNLPLMKLSAWHKQKGDLVEWYDPLFGGYYNKVYMSKVFSFSNDYEYCINADEVVKGGSGYCIKLIDGKEVFDKSLDNELPQEIEHIYPDYSLYPDMTKDTAYGFLTRGCPRGCSFCHVKDKEGLCSNKVANLSEFWINQKNIVLCDPNILACKDWKELLQQLIDSKAYVDFNQGIDVRLATKEKIEMLNKIKIKRIHMAWDNPHQDLTKDFERFTKYYSRKSESGKVVYVLTNYNSTVEQDLHRINTLRKLKYDPYVMIYDKEHADQVHRDIARWVNNRLIWRKCKRFEDYVA